MKAIVGKKYGMLTVSGLTKRDSRGMCYYDCVCDCGNKTNVSAYFLLNGGNPSCGCVKKSGRSIQEWVEFIRRNR